MFTKNNYDLTYITVDSLQEGVGSSQIVPLIEKLSGHGLRIKLISFEKVQPSTASRDNFKSMGVNWISIHFGSTGLVGGMERLNALRREITTTDLIHARSDIPAVSGIMAREAPVLWDVRSLWADQKVIIQKTPLNKNLYRIYRGLESLAANRSLGMSTLTNAVVPILENRHKRLPPFRTVVPTSVNLDRFVLSPILPKNMRALFSGTYNDYYDLDSSSQFMDELRKMTLVETHWARPPESGKATINVGETKIFPASQYEMAAIIPEYSFGMAVCRQDDGPSLSAAMPTKIAEFLASGRPIVVNKGLGDMDAFLAEFNAGVVLSGTLNNATDSAKRLVELLADPETPSRCRALAEKYFSMDVGATKYLDLYSKMLAHRN
jgi:hypothetical protein